MKTLIKILTFLLILFIPNIVYAKSCTINDAIDKTIYRYLSVKCSQTVWYKYASYQKNEGPFNTRDQILVRKKTAECSDYNSSAALSINCAYRGHNQHMGRGEINDVQYYRFDVESIADCQPKAKKRVANNKITRKELAGKLRNIYRHTPPYISFSQLKEDFKQYCKNNDKCNKKMKTKHYSAINKGIVKTAKQNAIWTYTNGYTNRQVKCQEGKSCTSAELEVGDQIYAYLIQLPEDSEKIEPITLKYKEESYDKENGILTIIYTIAGDSYKSFKIGEKPVCTNDVKCTGKVDGKTYILTANLPKDKKFKYTIYVKGIYANKTAVGPYLYVPFNSKGNKVEHQQFIGEFADSDGESDKEESASGNHYPEGNGECKNMCEGKTSNFDTCNPDSICEDSASVELVEIIQDIEKECADEDDYVTCFNKKQNEKKTNIEKLCEKVPVECDHVCDPDEEECDSCVNMCANVEGATIDTCNPKNACEENVVNTISQIIISAQEHCEEAVENGTETNYTSCYNSYMEQNRSVIEENCKFKLDINDVYYRTIDTKDVFPNRKLTSNSPWYLANEIIKEANNKYEIIGSDDIYKGTPEYEVTLTPKDMKKIREYYSKKEGQSPSDDISDLINNVHIEITIN